MDKNTFGIEVKIMNLLSDHGQSLFNTFLLMCSRGHICYSTFI